jgi:hypothetical protein
LTHFTARAFSIAALLETDIESSDTWRLVLARKGQPNRKFKNLLLLK